MSEPSSPFRITPPIFFIGLVSFLTDTASEMIYPLMPLFLTTVVGASVMFVGLVEGIAESTAAFAKYAFGWWSDRINRRTRFVFGGYALANTVRPLIGLSTAPWHVLGLRFVDRIGKGMRTAPRDAWLASMVAPEARGRAYGFHRAMDHAGAVAGPLIASVFLFFYPNELRSLFLWSIVPGLLAVACVLVAKRAQKNLPAVAHAEINSPPAGIGGIPRSFYPYFLILFLFTLGGSSDAFLLLKLTDSGVDVRMIPLLWAALHVVKSMGSLLGGKITDTIGRRPSIVLGWFWYATVYFALGATNNTLLTTSLFLGYGLYYGLTESAERAFVAGMVPNHARGRAFGLQNLIEGLGMLPASLLFGYLWKAHGAPVAFYTGGAFAFTAALLLLSWRMRTGTIRAQL